MSGSSQWRASVLIGVCCLLVYNANGRAITAGDTYPARYLPFAILHHHTVLLNPVETVTAQGRGTQAYWMVRLPHGPIISLYPVVTPLIVSPLYLPAAGYLQLRGWTDERMDHLARVMEKVAASIVAALSASLLFLVLRRRTTTGIASLLTIAYAFGTTTWVISSQALWQHGVAQLLVVGLLVILTAPSTIPRAVAAGLLCGLIACNRPPDLMLALALGAYGLFWSGSRRAAAALVVTAALPMGLVLIYNLATTGGIAGGYGLFGHTRFFNYAILPGLAGVLVSPTRGLLVFSPFLLFLALAWRHLPRDPHERGLTLAMMVGVVVQLLLYAKIDWRGGLSWGPRYMTDLLPLLIWMLVPVVAALRGFGRAAFLVTVSGSIAIEAIGAFCYIGSIDAPIIAVGGGPNQMTAAWDWHNAPFITSLRNGRAPAELMTVMRGGVDIEADGHATSTVIAGQPIVAAGWALAGHATPFQVAVMIDGKQMIGSQTFSERPDVRVALGTPSPAGWRIPIGTAGLAPGPHTIAAFAWASAKGEAYFLTQRTLTVQPSAGLGADPSLDDAITVAATRIRADQQEPGYWLTSYTTAVTFQRPRQEMNTFLTALLIDLLDPLADAGHLDENVRRARQHLTAQIEADGLVRYHGRPDGPTIGTLGCVITPDTDDTALAWRIAPDADTRKLTAALATIDRYRTGEGLYRTWLAPREGYQCIDPGIDPNPPDIAIQMHMLQLLSRVQPPAGRALCDALRHTVDQDRIWVYYRKTSLVPILRLYDLRRAGCALELPQSRMQAAVPGQEVWVSLVSLLGHAETAGSPPPDPTEMRAVLRQLAQNDFALLRTNPPLLYHNDLTATVNRYYWSEDVGYALWLRLAQDYVHVSHSALGS